MLLGQNTQMPNLASVLKVEVARLARKELRGETEGLKNTVASQRSDIAALKRRVQELEKSLKQVTRVAAKAAPQAAAQSVDEEGAGNLRFRAAGMAANRKRLGLSAADFGLLVGATGQSVYAWEQGKTKPRGRNLAAIAALRGLGKKDAAAKLAELRNT